MSVFSAKAEKPKKELYIRQTDERIILDGKLEEEAWQEADVASDFYRNFPVDVGLSEAQTEVRVTYDENFLYVAAINYQAPGAVEEGEAPYVVETLRRDFPFSRNDNFSIYIDPFNDQINGFTFGVNPQGAQREGLVFNTDDVSTDWDNKWFSSVERYDGYWIAEIAIPFKTLRFNAENPSWGINFVRNNLKINERSTWSPVPLQFRVSSLAFAGKMTWDSPPEEPGTNIALIPYVSGSAFKNYESGESELNFKAGGDAKVAVSPSLNLDITLNPDFSQVEADRQVVNLSRFDIRLPERRQFFLENSDLFEGFGFSRIRPFFSRRVGLTSPIIAGARLSGKIGQQWRVGVMNVQTNSTENEVRRLDGVLRRQWRPGENFTVAAVQRQMFTRSSLAAIFVNKQTINLDQPDSLDLPLLSPVSYNRVAGLDYNLASADNRWTGKIFYHRSFGPGNNKNAYAHAVYAGYRSRNLFVAWNHEIVGENYNAETGFVLRNDYIRLEPFLNLTFYETGSPIINQHGPRFRVSYYLDMEGETTDRTFDFNYGIEFMNTSRLGFSLNDEYVQLRRNFNPTNSPDTALMAGTDYRWQNASLRYVSDNRQLFNWSGRVSHGGYYNGMLTNLSGDISYRLQPYANFALSASYDAIRLPEGFRDANFFLLGTRAELTFTDKLFLTTFVQYNTQAENLNLNTRFQWRFKPVSDLFVVYTDNYDSALQVKTRALIVKLSYWLNV